MVAVACTKVEVAVWLEAEQEREASTKSGEVLAWTETGWKLPNYQDGVTSRPLENVSSEVEHKVCNQPYTSH